MKFYQQAVMAFVAVVAFIHCSLLAAGEFRVWRNKSGMPFVDGAYLSQTDELVIVVTKEGKVSEYSKTILSDADVALIATLPRLVSPYLKAAALLSTKQALIRLDVFQEMKRAVAENRRLLMLDTPQLFANGAAFISNTELRKSNPQQQAKPEKIVRTDQEIAKLREQLLAPTPTPTFVKELDFSPGWNRVDKLQLSEDGKYLAALLPGRPLVVEVWDLGTGKLRAKIEIRHYSTSLKWHLSPQGNFLAYGDRENQVVVIDLRTQQELHVHKAAAWAEEPLAKVAINYAEQDLYFLTDKGTLYRFPIGGGRGGSKPFFPATTRIENIAVLDISEDGDYVSCLVPGNIRMAEPMLRPTALTGLDPQEKTEIYQRIPEGQFWYGKVLNHGIVTANILSRDTLLTQECKEYGSGQFSGLRNTTVSTSRIAHARVFTDRAQRYVWKFGRTTTSKPGLDIYDLAYFSTPLSVEIPAPEIDVLQSNDPVFVSPESQRFVKYSPQHKKVEVYKLSGLETPPTWKFHAEIRRCLMEGDFVQLDKLVEPLFLDMRTVPGGTGMPASTEAFYAFRNDMQFYESNEDFRKRICAWQAAKPDSKLARLVVAQDAISRGFNARGRGTAEKVSEEGWRELKKLGLEAEQVLAPLFELEKPPAEAYLLQLRVALMLGYEIEKELELADDLMKVAPEYYPFHQQMMLNLLPRWGGQIGGCEKYASHLAAKLGAVKGEIMYGRLAVDLMKYHTPDIYREESKIDVPRAFKGLLLWDKNSPNDPEASLYVMHCYLYCDQFANLVTPENKSEFFACKKNFAKLIQTLSWNTGLERSYPLMPRVLGKSKELIKEW